MRIFPIILSGGEGARLWPLSRQLHPKPFIRLKNKSLLQQCYLRASQIPGVDEIVTVTHEELFFKTLDEYRELKLQKPKLSFILEPIRRNSAPAALLAAWYAYQMQADAMILLLPADHMVGDQTQFNKAVQQAAERASLGYVATFGVIPTRAETGYGYLHALDNQAVEFIEKPSVEQALEYSKSDRFFWNSGMFCMKASTLLSEAEKYCSELYHLVTKAFQKSESTENTEYKKMSIRLDDYEPIDAVSLDYAVMEYSKKIRMVPALFEWSDVGSFDSLAKLQHRDKNGNQVDASSILENVQDCIIKGEKNRLIAGVNLKNIMIIDTPDAVMVADKDHPQDIKRVYETLKAQNHSAYKSHTKVYRPWGSYRILIEYPNFKAKIIIVKPKGKLSLQSHAQRSEHWVVVQGTGQVILGDKRLLVSENEAMFVPIGQKHRIENTGSKDLIIIEVQYGCYLGEDDIERYEDVYARVEH